MARWLSNQNEVYKRNILRHRHRVHTILKYAYDNFAEPTITLDPSYLEALQLLNQPKLEIKEEILSVDSDIIKDNSEDELISVGSNEGWNGSYETTTFDEVEVDFRRKRVDGKRQLSSHEEKKNDVKINGNGELQKKRKRSWKSTVIVSDTTNTNGSIKMKFKSSFNRDLHNAKERECRRRLAEMFDSLQKHCRYLVSRRRIPTKISILLAAKTEVIVLEEEENKLIVEKNNMKEANRSLRRKLKRMRKTTNTDVSTDK